MASPTAPRREAARTSIITVDDLPRELRSTPSPEHWPDDLRGALRASETLHIRTILARTNQDKRAAAERLGISLSSLYRKLEELGIVA